MLFLILIIIVYRRRQGGALISKHLHKLVCILGAFYKHGLGLIKLYRFYKLI